MTRIVRSNLPSLYDNTMSSSKALQNQLNSCIFTQRKIGTQAATPSTKMDAASKWTIGLGLLGLASSFVLGLTNKKTEGTNDNNDTDTDTNTNTKTKTQKTNSKFDDWGAECADSIDQEKSTKDKTVYNKDVKAFNFAGDDLTTARNNKDEKKADEIYKANAQKVSEDEIATYDTDGDGKISQQEQIDGDKKAYEQKFGRIDPANAKMAQEASKQANMFMDLNGDGKVDKDEFASFLYATDTNNNKNTADGQVTRDEYEQTNKIFEAPSDEKTNLFKTRMNEYYKSAADTSIPLKLDGKDASPTDNK